MTGFSPAVWIGLMPIIGGRDSELKSAPALWFANTMVFFDVDSIPLAQAQRHLRARPWLDQSQSACLSADSFASRSSCAVNLRVPAAGK